METQPRHGEQLEAQSCRTYSEHAKTPSPHFQLRSSSSLTRPLLPRSPSCTVKQSESSVQNESKHVHPGHRLQSMWSHSDALISERAQPSA